MAGYNNFGNYILDSYLDYMCFFQLLMFEIIQFLLKLKLDTFPFKSLPHFTNRHFQSPCIAVFCVNIAVIIPVFCVEADIGVSILTNVIIVTLVRANRNNYKVTAETIFLSVVPLTQSVKARCCKLHCT